jgi:hypothetical protein
MAEPVLLEVRERRSLFGRFVKWLFLIFQGLMVLLMLGTCAAVTPYLTGPDPEVAIGAGMFGAMAIGTLWTAWPLGTLVLGLLVLFTRGRKRLIPAPATAPVVSPAAAPAWPAGAPRPPASSQGSVPQTGPRP